MRLEERIVCYHRKSASGNSVSRFDTARKSDPVRLLAIVIQTSDRNLEVLLPFEWICLPFPSGFQQDLHVHRMSPDLLNVAVAMDLSDWSEGLMQAVYVLEPLPTSRANQ